MMLRIVLEDMHFENDEAKPVPAAKEILKKDIQVLKGNPTIGWKSRGAPRQSAVWCIP